MTSRPQGAAWLGAALLAVGVSHVLAWMVAIWVVASQVRWIGGASGFRDGDETVAVVFVLLWLLGWVAGGSALAGHWVRGRGGARAGLVAAGAGALAFCAAIVVSLLAAEVLTGLRTPVLGIGLGIQLAVLLPGGGAVLALARVTVPVAVDLASAVAAGGTGVAGGLLAAPAWLALALVLVGAVEATTGAGRSWRTAGCAPARRRPVQ